MMRWIGLFFGLLFWTTAVFPLSAQSQTGETYYVAPNGSDTAAGSRNEPFATIQHGVERLMPGDTLLIRAGVYEEAVRVMRSGVPERPITIAGFEGEQVVINGRYQLPEGEPARCNETVTPPTCFNFSALLTVRASHIQLHNLHITQSAGRGISIAGTEEQPSENVRLTNCRVHDVRNAALNAQHIVGLHVDDCDFSGAANFATHDRSASTLNWPVAVNFINAQDILVENSQIHENHGEGMAAGRDSQRLIFRNNEIYDNFALQLYIHRAQAVQVENNLIYHTGNPDFFRGRRPSPCLVINNEENFADSLVTERLLIQNNTFVGCSSHVALWGNEGQDIVGSDIQIVSNRLIHAQTAVSSQEPAVALELIAGGSYSNISFVDNIIVQEEGEMVDLPASHNIRFAGNVWSRRPGGWVQTTSDVVAAIPLVNENAPLVAGDVQAAWYDLSPNVGSLETLRETAVSHSSSIFRFFNLTTPSQIAFLSLTLVALLLILILSLAWLIRRFRRRYSTKKIEKAAR